MAEKTYAKRLTPSGNSYGSAFAAAKKAGKKTFMWKGKDYTTETAEERKADFKKETRKEQFQRKERTGEGGGLTDYEAAHKTAKKQFGPNYDYTHKGKKFKSDDKGDKPRREGYDTMVMANKGGRIGKQFGGEGNTKPIGGRANLLEEVGRIDAEKMNPNRRAEKSRVIGELNRGYNKGGLIKGYPKLAKRGWK